MFAAPCAKRHAHDARERVRSRAASEGTSMKRTTTGFAAALLFSTAAHAIPISYTLNFDVEYVSNALPSDPDLKVGNRYFGSFAVDDALLLHDGLNQPGSLSAFR